MNDELERVCKEAVMVSFNALFQHSPGWTEEIHEKSFMIAGNWAEI